MEKDNGFIDSRPRAEGYGGISGRPISFKGWGSTVPRP